MFSVGTLGGSPEPTSDQCKMIIIVYNVAKFLIISKIQILEKIRYCKMHEKSGKGKAGDAGSRYTPPPLEVGQNYMVRRMDNTWHEAEVIHR